MSDWDIEFYGLAFSIGCFHKLLFQFVRDMWYLCQEI